jgi:hypothetical protein
MKYLIAKWLMRFATRHIDRKIAEARKRHQTTRKLLLEKQRIVHMALR